MKASIAWMNALIHGMEPRIHEMEPFFPLMERLFRFVGGVPVGSGRPTALLARRP